MAQMARMRSVVALRRQKKFKVESETIESGTTRRVGSEPPVQPAQGIPQSESVNDFGFLVNLVKEKAKEVETQRDNCRRAKQRESSANSKIEKLQKKIDSLEKQLTNARKAQATAESTLRKLAVTDSQSSSTLAHPSPPIHLSEENARTIVRN